MGEASSPLSKKRHTQTRVILETECPNGSEKCTRKAKRKAKPSIRREAGVTEGKEEKQSQSRAKEAKAGAVFSLATGCGDRKRRDTRTEADTRGAKDEL